VLRNFGEVGAGNLLSGMTVKHFNPIASIFIARKLHGCIVRMPPNHMQHTAASCLENSHRNLPCRGQ
jgi:hypothetical protein